MNPSPDIPPHSAGADQRLLRRLIRLSLVVVALVVALGIWQWAAMLRTENRLLRQQVELTQAELRQVNQQLAAEKIITDKMRQQVGPRAAPPDSTPSIHLQKP